MSRYNKYLHEIKERKTLNLHPKPIEDAELLNEIVLNIKDKNNKNRSESLRFLIYNVLPGTTDAANVKSKFLKDIILRKYMIEEISSDFAFELLSHMKGGPSIEVLLDLALGADNKIAKKAFNVLKTQVFLYEADMERIDKAYKKGNLIANELLRSYLKAEFFTKIPEIPEEIEVVTYVAGIGDISTDLLSPGADAHSRADRELHGQSIFDHNKDQQKALLKLQKEYPDKRIMLIAEKGTMGVGSSRMSGVNNVALWIGKKASKYVPFINIAPIVAGTNGVSPIFMTTVDVTGGIGLNLKNWEKTYDKKGNLILNEDGDPVLKQKFSVDTGTLLTINTKSKKLYFKENEIMDLSSSFTPQKLEFIRAGGSYSIVFGKKLQTFAANTLKIDIPNVFAPFKELYHNKQGLTAVEKIFNKNALGTSGKILHAGSYTRVKVNIVGSQDTTGLMTSQELEMMAAKVISPAIDGAYQSGCHTASVWDIASQENIPKLMKFMNDFGLITGRDPKSKYHPLTDVIHKVLNDLTVDDWSIIIGGDSHTRMSKGVAFGADSGTVALALATGEVSMPIPESVKVTFKGKMHDHMDFRDVVHATQTQMLKEFGGENVFQGRVIEVHIGTLPSDQAFTFTDWTAEMKAKASICISQDDTLIESLEIAKNRIQIMIDKGMDNSKNVLQSLIDKANKRIKEIKSGKKPAITPDENAKYYAEFTVDLDIIKPGACGDIHFHYYEMNSNPSGGLLNSLARAGGLIQNQMQNGIQNSNNKQDELKSSPDYNSAYNYGAPGSQFPTDEQGQIKQYNVKYTDRPSITGIFQDKGPLGANIGQYGTHIKGCNCPPSGSDVDSTKY